ncbi:unnamed protein product [Anisakis simplex]|uniref:Vesicle coat complex copii subunit sec31 n=1 Tax=Anisakis simplex TaxID=6269 RepID=A0A0M3KGZ3_ANISI|nr:unnamed protein product [Anisakis simplex]VDK71019.1 unnamed protein product [Anisakis simplex]
MPPASPSGMVYPQRMPPTMGPPPPQQQYNPYHPQMQQPQWNTQPQTVSLRFSALLIVR